MTAKKTYFKVGEKHLGISSGPPLNLHDPATGQWVNPEIALACYEDIEKNNEIVRRSRTMATHCRQGPFLEYVTNGCESTTLGF